ncbi:MAG TPA: alpha/beta fold hydrolase [Terriglobales bacterium]
MTHARIRSLHLEGKAGKLEALLNMGAESAEYAAVVAHPHPLFGGTMHNKVVFHAMKALNAFGFPVLRFNFRGVGTSTGEHDYGRGEIDDVRTAVEWMKNEYDLPLIFAGFSFGAATGVRAVCGDRSVAGIAALGLPLNADDRVYEYELLAECSQPKLFLSGDHDEFADATALRQTLESAADPKRIAFVPNADHFFTGHLDEMRAALENWVEDVFNVRKI